ncbi:hypothetical protein BC831DRAFT_454426 [Entophlyctis helioformis]|nr:hypothetical protein BC831DRAFT_454426 [Entophlyctis helioformis]
MTAINFSAHSADLSRAYEQVLSAGDPTNWAIFSYDRGSNDLKLFGSGDGGLEELKDEFEEGKIQYAFAKVVEPISGLPKYVLICWCGDGVPVAKKGLFNYHVNDIVKFFKGFHVQVNARAEDDVDPELIMKKVRDSAGAKYSIQKESDRPVAAAAPASPSRPLYSSNATAPATSSSSYNRFAASSKPTPAPAPAPTSYNPPKPSYGAPTPAPAPVASNTPVRPAFAGYNRPAPAASFVPTQASPDTSTASRVQAERERRERDEREQRDRAEKEMRDRQERERRASETEARQQQQALEQQQQQQQQQKQQQAAADKERADRERREAEERARREHIERQRLEAEARLARSSPTPTPTRQELPVPVQPAAPSLTATVLYDYVPDESNEIALAEGDTVTDIVMVDDGWWQGTNSAGQTGLFPANYVELNAASGPVAAGGAGGATAAAFVPAPVAAVQETHPAHEEPVVKQQQQQGAAAAASAPRATALYDYAAAEANELSFMTGDLITDIVFVSEDWWQGTLNGVVGLFPGNYVDLIQ